MNKIEREEFKIEVLDVAETFKNGVESMIDDAIQEMKRDFKNIETKNNKPRFPGQMTKAKDSAEWFICDHSELYRGTTENNDDLPVVLPAFNVLPILDQVREEKQCRFIGFVSTDDGRGLASYKIDETGETIFFDEAKHFRFRAICYDLDDTWIGKMVDGRGLLAYDGELLVGVMMATKSGLPFKRAGFHVTIAKEKEASE